MFHKRKKQQDKTERKWKMVGKVVRNGENKETWEGRRAITGNKKQKRENTASGLTIQDTLFFFLEHTFSIQIKA